ncbi:MAG: CHASE2 domain-containing protein, partial [Symploca sp. SIO2B6]|nr:CHASE2 domain-containing protein [Symploca sp. SIO2B6]
IQAGAKVVAVDVIIDQPSTWGDWDDLALQQTLQQSPGQAVLGSSFNHEQQDTGGLLSGIHPLSSLTDAGAMSGYINYPVEPNGRIHRFSRTWLQLQIANDPVISHHLKKLDPAFHHSFVQQTVAIAQSPATQSLSTQSLSTQPLTTAQSSEQPSVDNPQEGENLSAIAEYDVIANNTHQQRNQQIFFYGPTGETFEYESFWELLDPQTWKQHQQQQTFQDKIVLIGPTAQLFQDFHRTPFGQMPGVEVHANAIATYLEGRTINAALPHPHVRGIFVLIFTLGIGYGIGYPRRLLHRTAITIGAVGAWALLSYLGWLFLSLTFPIAVPMGALISIGMGYVVTGLVQGKIKLRGALKRYVSSPIVQDIINQQDDLQDLISEKEKESIGKRLDGRYEITSLLGAGGFGQTFVARDLHRPGSPQCVVKQLHPVTNDPQVFELSRRLFRREANTLERLGNGHKQIPQLLAYFEEANEFYLVQELIEGRSLSTELRINHPYSDVMVMLLLKELLEILTYIHDCGVIHRDIKPSNVIRRASDKKLVLIDFGAVKEMQSPVEGEDSKTVCIGTRGYIPNEQLAGSPRFSSDLYAVGIIGIQASTKRSPDTFEADAKTGERVWQPYFNLSSQLEDILFKMTRYDFKQRYQSAKEALDDLNSVLESHPEYDHTAPPEEHPYSNGVLPQNWNPPSDLGADTATVHLSHFTDCNMDVKAKENADQSTHFGELTGEPTDDSTLPWPTTMKGIVDGDEEQTNN